MNDKVILKTVIYFRIKYERWSFFENSYLFPKKTWMMKLFWMQLYISTKNINEEGSSENSYLFLQKTWMMKLFLKTVIFFHKKNMNDEAFSENSYQFWQKTWMRKVFWKQLPIWLMKLFWKQLSISAINMNDEDFLNAVIYFRKKNKWWNFSGNSYLFLQKTWMMKLFLKTLIYLLKKHGWWNFS